MKKELLSLTSAAVLSLTLSSCGREVSYEGYTAPEDTGTIKPYGSVYLDYSYEGRSPLKESSVQTYKSEDGLCTIEEKNSYYDVYLDYESGTYYEAGYAYGKTIKDNLNFYSELMEPYLYENIMNGLPEISDDYKALSRRLDAMISTLPEEYREELNGFADGISGGETGFIQNGIISREEAMLLQLVPDILRQTSCSALSFSNTKSVTGKRVTVRILEWDLGSENQLCKVNTVVHMKNHEKSIMQISYLGVLSTLTAVSDDGVTAGILDVGNDNVFDFSDKKSYTYYLRYMLENKTNATDAGKALTDMAHEFTFSHNVILSDADNAYVAENITDGNALLRNSDTPLASGIEWNSPDSICAVNTFISEKNNKFLTNNDLIRWVKYNNIINSKNALSVSDIKHALTCEKITDESLTGYIYSDAVSLILVTDYSDNTVQAVFTGPDGVKNNPDFIYLGSF